ncbi:NUDIX hydrolase [Chitiniphilus eburneus]|uniref:NUDIX domain-containing protein n=1 Tax=Chitiniphilus eburneus TaxID=2571148 RepID=A0A4U0Q654_9NEIS|nr:NUDIX domain-containing protein [Chitiniphilus eburneus]TJZ76260.1 NUDIX domain-containing protein [Chitiniphilus eburneus]
MLPIEVVTLVTLHQGRLLTVRKRGTAHFMLPGGKPESGEAPLAGLLRELREELGCGVQAGTLRELGRFSAQAANEPGRTVNATVYTGVLDAPPRLAAEIEALAWIDPAQPDVTLAPLLRDHVLPALRQRG